MKAQELPNDIESLKNLILEKEKLICELKETILILQRKKFAPTSEQLKDDPPEVNISNNKVENAIRPFAVGRKNWLFSASVKGA
jgi:transposase